MYNNHSIANYLFDPSCIWRRNSVIEMPDFVSNPGSLTFNHVTIWLSAKTQKFCQKIIKDNHVIF